MNKLLIGALAGFADLTQLVSSVKTKPEVEFAHAYMNKGGHSGHMNFFGNSIYQDQRLNHIFSPNSTQTTVAFNFPESSSITANPADNPNVPYYGNPYFCKERHEAQFALFEKKFKDMEGRIESTSKKIVSLNSDLDGVEPRLSALDTRANSNADMIIVLDQRA